MKIKFNWGFGIVVFIGLFMTFILSLVYKCSQHEVDLVASNYYDLEIQYQNQINKMNNSAGLDQQVMISSTADQVVFQFPEKFKDSKLEGSITFFKPDNSSFDFQVPLQVNPDLSQTISSLDMASGRWNVKVSYKDGQKEYYTEEKINLN
ncbi:MAG: FixH family protein [Bacteroidota bacterium]